ncbi:hypothetical protein INR49_003723 [Caranx melampygus]|nr:hypothetical protein INR49_003723 [Caranx melampygus]
MIVAAEGDWFLIKTDVLLNDSKELSLLLLVLSHLTASTWFSPSASSHCIVGMELQPLTALTETMYNSLSQHLDCRYCVRVCVCVCVFV